jgi:Uma2 family endonuclease
MATPAVTTTRPEELSPGSSGPLLEQGDRLSRDEFERRYARMPQVKKAELIEGTVYVPSPVRAGRHSEPHGNVTAWLNVYSSETPGVRCFPDATVRLDMDNEPQPDVALIKIGQLGGQARISTDDYLEGAPELVVEIVGSSRSYDLHQKKGAYRRNGVREFPAWNTEDNQIIWWQLSEGDYREIPRSPDGLLKSTIFPGLWLDLEALLRGDMKAVLATLRRGLESPEHAAFVGSKESL